MSLELTLTVYFVALLLCVAITRYIFSIPKIVRSQRAQAYLLAMIAHKQGCDLHQVKKAFNYIDGALTEEELQNGVK